MGPTHALVMAVGLFSADAVWAADRGIAESSLRPRAETVVVEVGERAGEHVDAGLVRRLVKLELIDLVIPPPFDAPVPEPAPPLYLRILDEETHLLVELWSRGELQGKRRVSVRGGQSLTARSIALVSAELSRQLAERRLREARLAARRAAEARRHSMEHRGTPLFARPVLNAALVGAQVGSLDAWLLGPRVSAELRFDRRYRIGIVTSGFSGSLQTTTPGAVQWLDAGVSAGYELPLFHGSTLTPGLSIAAASVHFSRTDLVDGARTGSSWNARSTAQCTYAQRFARHFEASLQAEAGAVLRHNTLQFSNDDVLRFGGLWAGVAVGFSYDPKP